MSPDDDPSSAAVESGDGVLHSASLALRRHTDARWVEISSDVLRRVSRVSRASHPVTAQAESGPFQVSEQVLITALQRELDGVRHCEVSDIMVHTNAGAYTGTTIIITARYPYPIISVADQIRERAQRSLRRLLGAVSPQVTVSAMHVHANDVTAHDPKLG